MKRILGLLGWLGVVLVLAALALKFMKPELFQWVQGLAYAGLAVTIVYTLSQWREIMRSFQGRNVRYGTVALASVLLFLGILSAINWISTRQTKRWDLTGAKQFSLSDQTKKLLTSLKKPVAVKVFYQSGGGMLESYRDRLEEYAHQTSQLAVEYVDPDKTPSIAKQFQIQQYGTVIFEYDGRSERTTSSQEQDLTNALIRVVEGASKKLYFVEGHGERDIVAGSTRENYSGVEKALKNDNFDVAKVAIAQQGKVPDDATVLVVAGPKTDYLDLEMDAIRAFLKKGGKLVMLLDPPDRVDAPVLTNLIALAKEWGIDVGNDYVLDDSGVGRMFNAGPEVPIAMSYPSHPITQKIGRVMTGYRLARSVTPIEGGANGHFAQKVVETSAQSWAETDVKSLLTTHAAKPDPKTDKIGPVSLVAAVSAPVADAPPGATPDAPKPETRVVVAGDSDFAADNMLGFQGNRDFFLNIANWAAQQEKLISIRPRDPEDRRITLSEDQGWVIFWATLAVPLLLFGAAFGTWWRRR